jgi:hypothetical protein
LQHVQNDLNVLCKFFHNHRININPNKTKLMIFSVPKKLTQISRFSPTITCHVYSCLTRQQVCQCTPITPARTIDYLGMKLDNVLKWDSHIQNMIGRLRIIHYKFYHIAPSLTTSTKRILYHSLVGSLLRYGIQFYSRAPPYLIRPLSSLVNSIQRLFFRSPCTVNILPLDRLIVYCVLCKYYFHPELRRIRATPHSLRNVRFTVPRVTNSYSMANPSFYVPKLLNELPHRLQNVTNVNELKYRLMEYLASDVHDDAS